MPDNKRRDWNVLDEKRAAIIDVLNYIVTQPATVGDQCVASDAYARKLFADPAIGNIDLGSDVKTVFMPAGELARKGKGSVVVELPPRATDGSAYVPQKPEDLLKFVLCCYNIWIGG